VVTAASDKCHSNSCRVHARWTGLHVQCYAALIQSSICYLLHLLFYSSSARRCHSRTTSGTLNVNCHVIHLRNNPTKVGEDSGLQSTKVGRWARWAVAVWSCGRVGCYRSQPRSSSHNWCTGVQCQDMSHVPWFSDLHGVMPTATSTSTPTSSPPHSRLSITVLCSSALSHSVARRSSYPQRAMVGDAAGSSRGSSPQT